MLWEPYENVIASPDKMEFEFLSKGPKGEIKKIIQFGKTSNKFVYNLSFGNLNEKGIINDLSVDDNKDRNKILATVIGAVYEFTMRYPDKIVFFAGTTPARTRLYRMVLTLHLEEFKREFCIYGLIEKQHNIKKVAFKKGKEYFGFMIERKIKERNFIV